MLSVFDQVALSPNEVCVILLGPSCGNPYNPWNQTWTVKLPPPQGHQWCQSHLQRYIRTCIHLTTCVGIGCTITEGGSCAARADSCAAHSLQPGSSLCAADRQTDHHVSLSASTHAATLVPVMTKFPLSISSPWCFCSSWQACSRPLRRLQLRLSSADLGDPAAACRQHEQQSVPGTAQCVCM